MSRSPHSDNISTDNQSLTPGSIIMQGTSPFAYKSPSLHSSSYLPKLEANFMRDFTCCDCGGTTLPSLHDLIQHYEETHSDRGPTLKKQNANHVSPQPDAKAARAAVAASNIQSSGPQQTQLHIDTSKQGSSTPQRTPTSVIPRETQSARQVNRGFAPVPPPQSQDDDDVGDMEMEDDFAPVPPNLQQPQYPIPNPARMTQRSQFGQPASSRVPPLDLNAVNMGNPLHQQYQGLRQSQPTTPVSAGRNGNIYHNNPTVSSVNTPTLTTYNTTHPLQQQYVTPESSVPGTPGELDNDFVGNMGNMNMSNMQFMPNSAYNGYTFGNGNEMLDLCIDEPAKRLFTLNGGLLDEYNQPQQPAPPDSASQLGDGQYSEDSELAKTIREEQKRAGVPDPSANDGQSKPFHCPVIGCEKAYKNQNGLKYHKSVSFLPVKMTSSITDVSQHGHNTQKLAANDNGTFSIVDPETLKAYPGTLGMEKHKPYRCDTCGKRYKNLNGLKYHKIHNPSCDSEIRMPKTDIVALGQHRNPTEEMSM